MLLLSIRSHSFHFYCRLCRYLFLLSLPQQPIHEHLHTRTLSFVTSSLIQSLHPSIPLSPSIRRLLPYLLDLITDNTPSVSTSALSVLSFCGQQYEEEHPDEIIERRQYGVDGDNNINLSKALPFPFTERPRIGKYTCTHTYITFFHYATLNVSIDISYVVTIIMIVMILIFDIVSSILSLIITIASIIEVILILTMRSAVATVVEVYYTISYYSVSDSILVYHIIIITTTQYRTGMRLYVRGNSKRFLTALVNELTNWIGTTRVKSARLLRIIVVLCEEHLTMEVHTLLPSLVKALRFATDDKEKDKELYNILLEVFELLGR